MAGRAWADEALAASAGGHTAEMLTLLGALQPQRYAPRCYVIAATDRMGASKARAFEQQLQQQAGNCCNRCIAPARHNPVCHLALQPQPQRRASLGQPVEASRGKATASADHR